MHAKGMAPMILMSRLLEATELGIGVVAVESGVVVELVGGFECCWLGYCGPLYQFQGMSGGSCHNLIEGDQGRVALPSLSELPSEVEGVWATPEVLALGWEMSEPEIDWRWRGMAAAKLALEPGNCMLGDKEPGLKLQVIVEGEGVVMVLSDSGCGRAAIEELELKGFVEIVVLEVELTADKGARGTAVDKGGEYLG
ncbi:hypothetical protein C0989_001018 [Termitomyces sp. Mn162]|nr:hypothetical protein C0989_001018 [Termitomyces sp. Mn162]